MTREEFQKLAESGVILLDGATGSNLRKAGMPVGVSTELWVLEHPEVIQKLQKEYAEAGSQIIYAPTFSANRISLAMHDFQGDIPKLNADLVAITKEAVGGKAYVAGDMTTTGKMLEPKGELSYQELMTVYQEQAEALYEAGVDLIVAETMLSVDETVVLLDAVQSVCDLPVMCTLTVEADGTALFGGNAVEAVETLQEMGAVAVGLNCSLGPDQLESVVYSMKKVAKVPVIAKPNAGMPVMDEFGMAHYNMTPEQFAASMQKLIAAGAGVIGGCCGTDPSYIRLLSEQCRK
ncbi:MAG: homocysteine S-methyltransferase family protein [Lachnospiraceae bacterium]|nr:homocysteine S-methyltransferase family protein [Lachnospiraceae bacterium]